MCIRDSQSTTAINPMKVAVFRLGADCITFSDFPMSIQGAAPGRARQNDAV